MLNLYAIKRTGDAAVVGNHQPGNWIINETTRAESIGGLMNFVEHWGDVPYWTILITGWEAVGSRWTPIFHAAPPAVRPSPRSRQSWPIKKVER